MTETELIEKLKEMGIVQEESTGTLSISDIGSLTFVHEATGEKFKFQVDSEGNLISNRVPDDEELLENRVTASGVSLGNNIRGFIG